MRRILILAFLACAAPAQAAPRPVAKAPHAFALAGDTVLLSHVSGRTLTVDALPGGRVFRYEAPQGAVPDGRLDASSQRAAMTITLETRESDIAAAQVVSGPPRGPWATLRPMTDLDDGFVLPYKHQLEGERLFTSEFRGSLEHHTVVVRDPDPRDLQLPAGAVFAGDLVAYTERGPGQDEDAIGRRLVVAEWRTGVRRGVTDLPEPIQQHALRPDGRVALTLDTLPGIYDVPLGGRPRLVTRRTPAFDHELVFAGEHLVFEEEGRLHVLDPDGRVRAFGIPTEELDGFVADDRRVLWAANGCLLVAEVTDPVAAAPAAGPCPRSELTIDNDANARLGRELPIRLRCVAAPSSCRGSLQLQTTEGQTRLNRPRRYSIPAGRTRTIRVELTERGHRALRAVVARDGDAGVWIKASSDDGDRTANGTLVLPR